MNLDSHSKRKVLYLHNGLTRTFLSSLTVCLLGRQRLMHVPSLLRIAASGSDMGSRRILLLRARDAHSTKDFPVKSTLIFYCCYV
jgi:hypothetical protein